MQYIESRSSFNEIGFFFLFYSFHCSAVKRALRLSKKGAVLLKYYRFRHTGLRSGISYPYQRIEIPHPVRDDAFFGQPHFTFRPKGGVQAPRAQAPWVQARPQKTGQATCASTRVLPATRTAKLVPYSSEFGRFTN